MAQTAGAELQVPAVLSLQVRTPPRREAARQSLLFDRVEDEPVSRCLDHDLDARRKIAGQNFIGQ